MNVLLYDTSVGADDQQPSEGQFAHFRSGSETLLADRRMLPWHQTQPSCKIPGIAETHVVAQASL